MLLWYFPNGAAKAVLSHCPQFLVMKFCDLGIFAISVLKECSIHLHHMILSDVLFLQNALALLSPYAQIASTFWRKLK